MITTSPVFSGFSLFSVIQFPTLSDVVFKPGFAHGVGDYDDLRS